MLISEVSSSILRRLSVSLFNTDNDMVITFMHGKDLIKYLSVKEWDNGYIVVECMGKVKGEYEDYIDMTYIMENLYMNPEEYLRDIRGVEIENA